jgi:hypothetical protein
MEWHSPTSPWKKKFKDNPSTGEVKIRLKYRLMLSVYTQRDGNPSYYGEVKATVLGMHKG